MDHLALWHTESNRVMSESGRRSSRRFSNTLDEEFSIVSEELLRSEETSEVGLTPRCFVTFAVCACI